METKAFRFSLEGVEERDVEVSDEELFKLFVDGEEIASISASPRDLHELATGFLVSGGFLGYKDIQGIEAEGSRIRVETDGGVNALALGNVVSEQRFSRAVILRSLRYLEEYSREWRLTGGTHSASLITSGGKFLKGFEDISRRSSFYKLIGWAFMSKQPLDDKFILSSSRISGDIAEKLSRVGVPLLVSKTTPLSKAVEAAERFNITLIGFARDPNFTVYANPWRII